jgi:hypothetical protein
MFDPLTEGAKHTFVSGMGRAPKSEKKNTCTSPTLAGIDFPKPRFAFNQAICRAIQALTPVIAKLDASRRTAGLQILVNI